MISYKIANRRGKKKREGKEQQSTIKDPPFSQISLWMTGWPAHLIGCPAVPCEHVNCWADSW